MNININSQVSINPLKSSIQADGNTELEGQHSQLGRVKAQIIQTPLLQSDSLDIADLEEFSMLAASKKKDDKSKQESLQLFQKKLAHVLYKVQEGEPSDNHSKNFSNSLTELKQLNKNTQLTEEQILEFVSSKKETLSDHEFFELISMLNQSLSEIDNNVCKNLLSNLKKEKIILNNEIDVFSNVEKTLQHTFESLEVGNLKSLHAIMKNEFSDVYPDGINWARSYFACELVALSNSPDQNQISSIRTAQNQIAAAETIYEKCIYISQQSDNISDIQQ